MTEQAQQFLVALANRYASRGFPNHQTWGFNLSTEKKTAFGNELRARNLLVPMFLGAEAPWRLTDEGLELILSILPLSEEAKQSLAFLKQLYVGKGNPNHKVWNFTPAADSAAVTGELRARGYIEPMFMGRNPPMRLTDWGVSELLDNEFGTPSAD